MFVVIYETYTYLHIACHVISVYVETKQRERERERRRNEQDLFVSTDGPSI